MMPHQWGSYSLRMAPEKSNPVVYEGIRYVAPNDDGRACVIRSAIKALNAHDGRLTVISEHGNMYEIDLKTKAITRSDRLLSPSPSRGAIHDIPDAAKRALAAGSLGKEYDFSDKINPTYLEGDFNGDGKIDVAVLLTQRSTGKLGIAIVHGTTGKVTILGAGFVIGNGGDDFEWMDSWLFFFFLGFFQSARRPCCR